MRSSKWGVLVIVAILACGTWAFGQSGAPGDPPASAQPGSQQPMGQGQPPQPMGQPQPGQTGRMPRMHTTPDEMANLVNQTKISLCDAIRTAETHAKGKAVDARVRADYMPGHMDGQSGGHEHQQSGHQGQQPGHQEGASQKPAGQSEHGQQPLGRTGYEQAVWAITCLTNDNHRFVEVFIDGRSGAVVDTRERAFLPTPMLYGAAAPPAVAELPADEPGRGERLPQERGAGIQENGNPAQREFAEQQRMTEDGTDQKSVQAGRDPKLERMARAGDPGLTTDQTRIAGIQQERGEPTGGSDRAQMGQQEPSGLVEQYRSAPAREATRWQKASDLSHKSIVDSGNNKLGEVKNLAVDPDTGRTLYVITRFSDVPDTGNRWYAVPFTALTLSGDYKDFILAMTKDQLRSAPGGFDSEHWPNLADSAYVSPLFAFYHVQPYEGHPVAGQMGRTGSTDGMNRTPSRCQKSSDLIGKDIRNDQNEKLGDLQDMAIDPDSGWALFGIIKTGGVRGIGDKYVPLPWSELRLGADAKEFVANITTDRLKNAPQFSGSNWPDLASASYRDQIYSYYGVRAPWTARGAERPAETNPPGETR
jgi:sporulation protein YlmC with PRC-barrel domain